MRWLTTALLLLATGYTSQPQTPVSEKPSQLISPKVASAAATTSTVAQTSCHRWACVGEGDTVLLKQDGKTFTLRLDCRVLCS